MKKTFLVSAVAFLLLFPNNSIPQWVMCNGPYGGIIYSLASSSGVIFAGCEYGSGLYRSTNNGTYWSLTSLTNQSVYSLAARLNYVYAGTYYDGLYRSKDYGSTWQKFGLGSEFVRSVAVWGSSVYAGTMHSGVYVSSDNGENWIHTELNNKAVLSVHSTGTMVFAGTSQNGVYYTTNNGLSWVQTSLDNQSVCAIAVYGCNVFAGTLNNGVFVSSNNGQNWSQSPLNSVSVYSLTAGGNSIFAGTYYDGIYKTTDCGANWVKITEGCPLNYAVMSLMFANNYLFAGTNGHCTWRHLAQPLIEGGNNTGVIPVNFVLHQNYPNPFNGSTKIVFEIPAGGVNQAKDVRLAVYDNSGREVQTLVNGSLNAGIYEVSFDALNLASGAYFYVLSAGDFSAVKTMMLLK